jgi:hypothetical protein
MAKLRADLTAHVGGAPSATQRAMIEQAVQLSLRLALMDEHFAETVEMTEHDSRCYLAWSNALTRLMARMGTKSAAQAPRSLQQHLAARAGAAG